MDTVERHKRFVDRLLRSRRAVFRVAEWLHSNGHDVMVPATKARQAHEDPADYQDCGDLFRRRADGGWERVEVKGLGTEFCGREDWPYRNMIVSNKAAVERAEGVVAYVMVNPAMTHVAVIPWRTRAAWEIETVHAGNTEKQEDFYVCPMEHVTFCKLNDGAS